MAPEKDVLMQFGDRLKGLKNLRKQLHSAADCFESSYNKQDHKQFVMETSREYVMKALVSTVDHLGCTAHKLNKLLDEKAAQLYATNIQLSLIHQRLRTIEGLAGVSHNMFKMQHHDHTNYQKHHLLSGTCECNVVYRSSAPLDKQPQIPSRDIINKKAASKQIQPPFVVRKKESTKAPSPNPTNFSFTTQKLAQRRSVSPLRLLSASVIKRSVSPTPSPSKGRWASEPRRAISADRRRHDTMARTKEVDDSYGKRSKHLLKALLSLRHSKQETTLPTIKYTTPP